MYHKQCNTNDHSISSGYGILKNDDDGDSEVGLEQIGRLPNIQNRSWNVTAQGVNIQVIPYITYLDVP